jgi:hypothetical protein
VRRARPPVQQPGGTQHECARAHAQDSAAAIDRTPQRGEQRLGPLVPPAAVIITGRRDRDEVGGLQAVQSKRSLQAEAGSRSQQAGLTGHDSEVIARQSLISPIGAKYLADHAEFERREAV